MSSWLNTIALIGLILGWLSALIIIIDLLAGHKQHMWIMNIVWPVTALWSGPLGLWAYFKVGRLSTHHAVVEARKRNDDPPGKKKPDWQAAGVGATHCGSGCTLGDIAAEWLVLAFPVILFGKRLFGTWALDYILAFLFGIAFQYFTIKPMKELSPGEGLKAAVKADTLSLTAWQVGMYGWMAIAVFLIFGHEIPKTSPVFWFIMQIAMFLGFFTSYPVNLWLIKKGIKEKM